MARNDAAVLKPTTGHYYYNPTVGATVPADLTAITGGTGTAAGWVEFGHTSIEDLLSITSEGGEVTVLGTLQNPNLRTSTSARTETFAFTLQQFDEASLKFYFGSNADAHADDARFLTVPSKPTPVVGSFLVVFEDGEAAFGFWAEKAEVSRGDDLSLADTESLAGLPLNVRPLILGDNDYAYSVTPLVEGL